MLPAASEFMENARRARSERRLADAHHYLLGAVALCRQAGAKRELLIALKALGQTERDMGHCEAARRLYEEAVTIGREVADPLLLAHTIRHLGDIHQDAGRLLKAEPCYHEALAIYRSHEDTDKLDLANAVRPLAILKDATGEWEEASRLWKEALTLYEAVGVPAGIQECSAQLARCNS